MKVTLEISTPGSQRTIELEKYSILIVGRGEDVDIRLADDPHFSRRHFRLEIAPPHCELVDLSSRNGTLVNGEAVKAVRLNDGDVISGGRSEINVRISSTDNQSTLDVPSELELAPTKIGHVDSIETRMGHSTIEQIGNYRCIREIGRGSMGVVYKAIDEQTGQQAALKIVIPTNAARETHLQLFVREMRLLSQLSHPRLIQFLDVGLDAGQMFLATEYVDHQPFAVMAAEMTEAKRIRFSCGIISQVLDALEYVHKQGIIHRDVKPTNILLTNFAGKLAVKVSDFGLAKSYQDAGLSGLTSDDEIRGTLAFMSREQAEGRKSIGPVADLYSAGATLYWYLTGRLPYDFELGIHPVAQVLSSPPIPISERAPTLPRQLTQLVEKTMNIDPQKRFSSAEEMRAALRTHLRK